MRRGRFTASPSLIKSSSELQPQCKLHLPGLVLIRRRDRPKHPLAAVAIRDVEVRLVQGLEGFCPELQPEALRQGELLVQAQVHHIHTPPGHNIRARIAEWLRSAGRDSSVFGFNQLSALYWSFGLMGSAMMFGR